MRIAYVFDPLLPQTETDTEQALNTVTALGKRGADVVMYLPRPNLSSSSSAEELRSYYRLEKAPAVVFQRSVYKIPEMRVGSVAPSRAIEKVGHAVRTLFNRELRDFDVVYTRNIPIAIAALVGGHKVMYETYRPWPEQYPAMKQLFAQMMSHPRFLGAVLHSAYAKNVYAGIGIEETALEVVHNGYRPDLFEPRLSRIEARARLGLPLDRPLVTYTGRVTMGKGLGLVLDVAAAMPEVDFAFVGSEGQGEVEERAQELSNVHIIPWTSFDELPPYLFASDILLIPPSLIPLQKVGNTVLPMKLFLYLASGRPILAPRSPDTSELLRHDENAWLIEPDDVDAAVAGIRRLLDDRNLATRLADSAMNMARELTWDARADKVIGFIRRRLATRG